MKRLSKLLLIIFMLVFAINVVNADNCENISMNADASGSGGYPFIRDAVKMNFEGGSVGNLLTFKDSSGKELPAYCHNVSKPTGAKYGITRFKCTREIFDTSSNLVTSNIRDIYDAGLIKILTTGYGNGNTSTGVVGYTATDLAVKTYELLFPANVNTNNMNSGKQSNYLKAYQYFANKMLDDSEVTNLLKATAGSARSKYDSPVSYTWASNGDQIEKRAKELIIIGLTAAKEFKENGTTGISWNSNPVVSKDAVLADGGVTNYSGSLAYTFKLSNFTSKGSANVKFTCANCSENGVSYKVYANDEELGSNYTGAIDLLSRITNGTGEVTVKVVFTADSNHYGCEELDYKFELNYKDETISGAAYEMYSTDTSCIGNACQPIYVLGGAGVTKTVTVEDSFSMCTLTCAELEAKCAKDGASSKACKEFKKQYPQGCINCGVGMVNNVCADPGNTSDLALIEGYEIDPETCTQGTGENITGCILENKDAAGNPYKDESLGNNLCSVSCKEDFHFKLPGNIDVSEKRHFALKVDLKATKTCYLKMHGTPNAAAFAEAAQTSQELYENCAYLNAETHEVVIGRSNQAYYTYSQTEVCKKMLTGEPCTKGERFCQCTTQSNKQIAGYCESEKVKFEYKYTTVENCSAVEHNGSIIYERGQIVNSDKTGCEDIPESAELKEFNEKVAAAGAACEELGKLTSQATVTVRNVPGVAGGGKVFVTGGSEVSVSCNGSIYCTIGGWNACALWEMNYDFNPDMYFYYEDAYMKSALTDKLDLIGTPTASGTTHYYCSTDDGDAAYQKCSGGWKTSPIFRTEQYCVCSGDGCKNESVAINNTMRMKESISYETKYITPTQFYSISPHGEIVASLSGEGLENAVELTNALPVGLGVPHGAYHYALYAKNLGEYFGTGKYGRVWGNKNSVVAKTLKANDKCFNNGDLKYDTKIEDTYIDKGVWVCRYCIGEDCYCPDCPPEVGFKCQYANGKYWGKSGTEVTYKEYKAQCCKDGDCPVELFINGKPNFAYRPVSAGDFNPNDRDLGPNWNYDSEQVSTALEMKAAVTTRDIILDGETIYDEGSHKYVMKVNMDSALINTIKNRKNKEYTENTLECYDYEQDGKTYKNVFCYSSYLDELLNNSKTKDKITFGYTRPSGVADRKRSQASDYWTTWTERLENGKWDVKTTKEISYFRSNYGEIGIGPSWK